MEKLNYTFNIGFEEPMQIPPYSDLLYEETSFSLEDEPAFTFHTDAFMIFNQERIYNQLGRSSAEDAMKLLTGMKSNTLSEDSLSKDVNPFDVVKSRHAQSPSELRQYAKTLSNITEQVSQSKQRYIDNEKRNKEYQKSVEEFRRQLSQKSSETVVK